MHRHVVGLGPETWSSSLFSSLQALADRWHASGLGSHRYFDGKFAHKNLPSPVCYRQSPMSTKGAHFPTLANGRRP
jgi:hypothetical protein